MPFLRISEHKRVCHANGGSKTTRDDCGIILEWISHQRFAFFIPAFDLRSIQPVHGIYYITRSTSPKPNDRLLSSPPHPQAGTPVRVLPTLQHNPDLFSVFLDGRF